MDFFTTVLFQLQTWNYCQTASFCMSSILLSLKNYNLKIRKTNNLYCTQCNESVCPKKVYENWKKDLLTCCDSFISIRLSDDTSKLTENWHKTFKIVYYLHTTAHTVSCEKKTNVLYHVNIRDFIWKSLKCFKGHSWISRHRKQCRCQQ